MISEANVKSMARHQGVDPAVIDRDHALGVVLAALAPELTDAAWVFKGGTCLRKCHFGDYRFSEDLDFTVLLPLSAPEASRIVGAASERAIGMGVRLLMEEARIDTADDEYGRASVEIKIPYRGALRMGSAQNVQFHLSSDERMVFAVAPKTLIHPYEDAADESVSLDCYALEEVLSEKLRAVGGQRRHAIARDVYDVAQLVRRGADTSAALSAVPAKAVAKGVDVKDAGERFRGREGEYRASWGRTLAYLMVDSMSFDDAFSDTAALLERLTV